MKKITLLVSEKERKNFILKLRELGVVHVKHVKMPVSHEIHFLEEKISKIEKMLSILSIYAEKGNYKSTSKAIKERDVIDEDEKVEEAYRQKQNLKASIREGEKHIQWFENWGAFDPDEIHRLKRKGIEIKLYRLKKDEFKKLKQNEARHVIKKDKGYVYFAVLSYGPGKELASEEVALPGASPEKLALEIKEKKEKITQIDMFLKEEAGAIESIKKYEEKIKREHQFLNVKFGMHEEEKFSYLQGFCPAKLIKKVLLAAKQYGSGYLIEEPDNPDETPTLITNPKWINIISPVFQFMKTLPGYSEFDISFYFLLFFSLFFAMLIGDAGYGILFLVITFLARCKLKKVPGEPFFLMYLLSIGTICWGAVTGTWFGARGILSIPFFNNLVVQKIGSFTEGNQDLLIFICFSIGVVHLTIAHVLRAVRTINSAKAVSEVGWIMILWGMFFTAGKFVIGNPFPQQALWLFLAGITLVLFFSNIERGILKGMGTTLADLPLSIISSFSDIVSYLRLFAVGYASVIVAKSFNDMALAGGIHSVAGAVASAMILFLGHTLNIVLGFMAVVVHGIRLNMLEFSGHLGMQWSGKEYKPFSE